MCGKINNSVIGGAAIIVTAQEQAKILDSVLARWHGEEGLPREGAESRQLQLPAASAATPQTLGRISSALGARPWQLALRYEF